MATDTRLERRSRWGLTTLDTRYHRASLGIFMIIVLAHWAEHVAQAIQVYALDWPIPEARGVLGVPFPWLATSEWMHYAYALVMLVGLAILQPGFTGRAKVWWNAALIIQVWHHFEHLLLLIQKMTGNNLAGKPMVTSIVQLVVPRVELHLFYNAIVFLPMVVAMILHRRPRPSEYRAMRCTCAEAPAR